MLRLANIYPLNKRENNFNKIYKDEKLSEIKYLGIQTIAVKQIIGSVNRWQDFDLHFRSEKADQKKLQSILKAIEKDVILPPIKVYKIKNEYYIIDGNHRVVAAKMLKQVDIDAEVYELVPPGDSLEHILWREKSRFEWKTGLNLEFTEVGSYNRLLAYLRLHARQLSQKYNYVFTLKTAASQWYNEVYQPVMRRILEENLEQCFPAHTKDDLFLYVIHHQLTKARLQGRKVDALEAVKDFIEKPETVDFKISNLFKGFVYKKKCRKLCGKCTASCPEGLICTEDGRLKIKEDCNGCGLCHEACPEGNPVAYDEIISS